METKNLLQIETRILSNPHRRDTERLAHSRIMAWMDEFNNRYVDPIGTENFLKDCQNRRYRNRYIDNLKGILKKSILTTIREQMISGNAKPGDYVFAKTIWSETFDNIRIKKPIKSVETQAPPSSSEVNKMVELAQDPIRGLMIAFTFSMGLRNAEVRNIKLSDITRHARSHEGKPVDLIYICSKNQNERRVPVRSDYIDIILEVSKPIKYLFERLPGVPFSERTFQRIVETLGKKATGRRIYPHLLRHALATEYYDKTLDIIGGANFLGHQPKVFSGTYAKPKQNLDVINITDVDGFIRIAKAKAGII